MADQRPPAGSGVCYRRNVGRIHAYQALSNLSFWMPVWIVFLQTERGLGLAQITAMMGIAWLFMAFSEVPTGILADRYGHRTSLALGAALVGTGTALFALLPGYTGILAAFLVWSVGLALQSGADMAMLYDSLRADGAADDYVAMSARSYQIIQGLQAVAGVVGSWVAVVLLQLPILLSSGFAFMALAVVLTTREPPEREQATPDMRAVLSEARAFLRTDRAALYLMLFTAVLMGVAWAVPFVLFQPYMVAGEIEVGWLGALFMLLRLSGAAGSRYGVKLVRPPAVGTWYAAVPVGCVLAFAVIAAAGRWWLGFAGMLAIGFLGGSLRPFLSNALNERVPSQSRATLLSLQSLLFTLFLAGLQPALGVAAERRGLGSAFVVLGCLAASLLVVLALWQRAAGRPVAAPAAG